MAITQQVKELILNPKMFVANRRRAAAEFYKQLERSAEFVYGLRSGSLNSWPFGQEG